MEFTEEQLEQGRMIVNSPTSFVELMLGITPTYQQQMVLDALENGDKRIAIRSGRGIGKTALLSWVILWYLFSHDNCNVICTAPTSDQLKGALWREVNKNLEKMPKWIRNLYDPSDSFIRMKEKPKSWFAVARTARKENAEALRGSHDQNLLYIIDEASGVPAAIFESARGSLTDDKNMIMMTGNPTRLHGYFYEAFHKNEKYWTTFAFSAIDSPMVGGRLEEEIKNQYGEDSDEYRIEVLGQFPKEDSVDEKGYIRLISRKSIDQVSPYPFIGELHLGIDPAGGGKDKSVWVLRDDNKARVICKEKISSLHTLVQKTLTIINEYDLLEENITIDNFGVGANLARDLAVNGYKVKAINVGDTNCDPRFLNKRAEYYWRLRERLKAGFELIKHKDWEQLLHMQYRATLSNKIQIKPKLEMKKDGIKSPDVADALMLTFSSPRVESYSNIEQFYDQYIYDDYVEEAY